MTEPSKAAQDMATRVGWRAPASGKGMRLCGERDLARALDAFAAERVALLRAEYDAADHTLVDKYRDPKTGWFSFPRDAAKLIRQFEAETAKLREALDGCRSFIAGCEQIRDGLVDGTTVTAEWVRDFFADLPDLSSAPQPAPHQAVTAAEKFDPDYFDAECASTREWPSTT